jgi:hypothetical protein
MFVQLLSGKDTAYKVNILAGTWFSLEHFAERSTPPQFWGLLDEKGAPWPTETSTFTILTEALAEANYEGRISGPENLEGYEFVRPDHSICVVLWSNGGIASYSFPVSSLRWLDRTRKAVNVTDGNLGDKDSRAGWVGLALDSNPIFVEYSTETATREPAAVTSTETATREPTATVTSTIPVPPSPTWPQDTPTEPQAQREQGIPTLVAAARQEPAAEFLPLRIDGTMGLVAIALAGVISSLAFLVWRSRPNR